MSRLAIEALRAEQQRVRELVQSLTADEWAAASGCTGWTVQDVVTHMGAVFHSIADPSTIEGGTSDDVERNAEVPVQARRSWTPGQVVAEYEEWSERGIAALAGMQEPPLAEMVIPLANLGSHPMHLLANAIVFDHYCHLRHDIGAAVPRAAALPHDPASLAATLEWMLAGLPQMCAAALAQAPAQTVVLAFDGPGGGTYTLAPGEPHWTVSEGATTGAPTARTTVHDFVSWGTKRSDWRDCVQLEDVGSVGAQVAAVLDAINVI
jgi:uncharacterized protein (TIGR03083 family)